MLHNNNAAALNDKQIISAYCMTIVLHWLENNGTLSAFVRNRVSKIQELTNAVWKYVPTEHNPSDLGTRSLQICKVGDLWLKGPTWLKTRENSQEHRRYEKNQNV